MIFFLLKQQYTHTHTRTHTHTHKQTPNTRSLNYFSVGFYQPLSSNIFLPTSFERAGLDETVPISSAGLLCIPFFPSQNNTKQKQTHPRNKNPRISQLVQSCLQCPSGQFIQLILLLLLGGRHFAGRCWHGGCWHGWKFDRAGGDFGQPGFGGKKKREMLRVVGDSSNKNKNKNN